MKLELYREYRLKFYLNARHYIIINGNRGEDHPHTWEFSLIIRTGGGVFTEFGVYERRINEYLAQYQNRLLNDVEPFTCILPTLESMTDYFSKEFYHVLEKEGGTLVQVIASETPARSYIVNVRQGAGDSAADCAALDDLVDAILNNIQAQEEGER